MARRCIVVAVALGAASCAGEPRTARPSADAQAPAALAPSAVTIATAPSAPSAAEAGKRVDLGRSIFFDTTLSNPPGTSCASCHDPRRAFSGAHGSTTGLPGGSRPDHTARRASPSLLYLKYVPRFRLYQEGDDPEAAPFGGYFWDGRADAIADLVRQPLLNPDEMNAGGASAIASRIARGIYARSFRALFGDPLDDPEATLSAVGRAVDAFLTDDAMAPFSSRYDDFVRGDGALAPQENEGLRLFQDPRKGGCSGCHLFEPTAKDPARSLFTDYGYDATGAPRNAHERGRKPDLGLCERTDTVTPTNDARYCESFRTPSLRNVALRESFMHDGAFLRLRDVVAFYATRDTEPRRWYPSGVKFEDVPAAYRGQINATDPPYGRRPGDAPALNDREIDAVVAFLNTLTDRRAPAR